ncbi:glutamate:gamma-aminobutyrate antiporter [Listeria monocytogenes]|uniref:Glutamate/gamma-aminobutyrate antiporter n=1 Tax=Listeria monocytogenes TaxID=1639 RepID=A0A6X0RIN5_LISMN|nr:glutamate:gamma-aminobutyrate antiporter [Listeria monocytogenes]EAF8204090.1 glutamate:gamma-aminobutyrate antiporter [Listeria monocytogenes]EAG9264506.1 glutamate:gamma-aminobutyrate antiporter [Listeria monocytogenes]EFO8003117.1 glutamate:gamma-aminobutyrate antiporter [Listeria monocytogenes]EHN7542922.1 glutamate:gamma-aminobutyrate antiporter [Listeria monocytogenes]EJH1704361.1 glutamate:gamma-aminobutyrate antiporter [Listeria monocytogenes]
MSKQAKSLTLFGFFAITASMVMTVYEYPTFATSGFHLVFFLLLGGFLWFLPVALCAAEMATVDGWQEGGIFSWVGNTLGERFGFAAIFFQWFQITVGFVTMIYFILGALSYVFDFPALESNPFIKFIGVLIIFWGLTFSQLGGTKNTAKIAKFGFIIGILIPAIILFILGIAYVAGENPLHVTFSKEAFIPDFSKASTLVIFVSFILAYMGVEASASHVNEMTNPKRDYPLAMIMLVILAIALNTIGGLTISAVLPLKDLSLSSGVVQTFQALILHFGSGLGWAVKLIAIMIALGVMGEVSAWVVGPSRGMYTAAEQGLLPEKMKKVNKHGVPVPLIMVQGIVVTVWAAILTFGGGGNNLSFLTAISLTVVIYLVGYLLFFIGYLVLIFKKSSLKRTYQIPGGKIVKVIVALIGLVTSVFALCISFVPPASIAAKSDTTYMVILSISFIVTVLIPFIIYAVHDKKDISPKDITHLDSSDINKFTHPRARGEHIINPDDKHIMNQDKL